ncbi:MAG: hypothetical protein MMC23_009772 [Stictis urceolatum]|nr:hypothetical protein [Stictis urceolata]
MSNIKPNAPDPSKLATPQKAIGTPTASVSEQIADVQRLMKASGLEYSMHSAGTTVEGSWEVVMRVIGQAHQMLHEKGVVRIQTDIRVGSRMDKAQSFSDKVTAVENILAKDDSTSGMGTA